MYTVGPLNIGSGAYQEFAMYLLPPADQTAPTTTITLSPAAPNGTNGWYTAAVGVSVNATDPDNAATSVTTRCALDPASVPASFADLPAAPCGYIGAGLTLSTNGVHVMYAASQDPSGNTEAVQSTAVKIDTVAPSTAATATPGTLPPNAPLITVIGTATLKDTAGTTVGTIGPGTCYNTPGQVIKLTATDNPDGSGIASITYAATGAQPIAPTPIGGGSGSVPITKTGFTTLTYAAADVAGNNEATKSVTVLAGNSGTGLGFACGAPTPMFTLPSHGSAIVTGTATVGTTSIPFTITIRF